MTGEPTAPTGPPTVLLAPDKFKGSLTAAEVADAVAAGMARAGALRVVRLPVADGGDGTVAAAVAAGFDRVPVTATGPTGRPVATAWARRGRTAVVELADACGLVRLPDGVPDPVRASSRGLGEVVRAAVEAGCTDVVVGIGGSASTDGGAGMLAALGARLTDGHGGDLAAGGGALPDLAAVDLGALRDLLAGIEITVASDVDNPLTGPRGAAATYGPQKGADDSDVAALDAALTHWADVVDAVTGTAERDAPGAGAAGGVGYAALAVLGARLRPGIDVVLDLTDFTGRVAGADLVVTGEGSLDEQTLSGKAPAGVAAAAAAHGVLVVAVAGRCTLDRDRLAGAGITAAHALTDLEPDPRRCMDEAARLLGDLGERIAREHLPGMPPPV